MGIVWNRIKITGRFGHESDHYPFLISHNKWPQDIESSIAASQSVACVIASGLPSCWYRCFIWNTNKHTFTLSKQFNMCSCNVFVSPSRSWRTTCLSSDRCHWTNVMVSNMELCMLTSYSGIATQTTQPTNGNITSPPARFWALEMEAPVLIGIVS